MAALASFSGVIIAGAELSSPQHCRMGLYELHDGTLATSTRGLYKHRNGDDVWLHYWDGEWLVSIEKEVGDDDDTVYVTVPEGKHYYSKKGRQIASQ